MVTLKEEKEMDYLQWYDYEHEDDLMSFSLAK
jgi:hypothetical protein